MPGLLDYVFKGYQDGGNVDFDPYADTSLADQLNKMGISVDSDAMGLLPTYDTTGADIAREGYRLRSDATRRGATGNLFDLARQSEIQAGQTGFAGAGAGLRQFEKLKSNFSAYKVIYQEFIKDINVS